MNYTRRAIRLPHDNDILLDVIRQHPERHPHVIDLPYRLSSWALDEPDNGAIWLDQAGKAQAWAVLQSPFWNIDLAVRDAPSTPGIYSQVLAWAEQRALELAGTPSGRPCWFVLALEDQVDEIQALESAGFACQTDVPEDPWVRVQLLRPLPGSPGGAGAPAGFHIRPLGGPDEAAAYTRLHRAAFGSDNMSEEWRRRTMARPDYCADLDLVAEADDGRLAAFCIGWYHPQGVGGGPAAQVEPLGVHPDFQRRGLGSALLAELFRRAARRGARQVYVDCDDYPDGPAFGLYHSAGFEIHRKIAIFRKDFPEG